MKRLMMVMMVVASLLVLTVGAANAGPSPEAVAQLQAEGAVGYFDTDDGRVPDGVQSGWQIVYIQFIIADNDPTQLTVGTQLGYNLYITSDIGVDACMISYANDKYFWIYVTSSNAITKYAFTDTSS